MNERTFKPSEAAKLEDPERLEWLPPDRIIARLGLRPGMTVADIGAGTGYFAIPMARVVGEAGRIFAVDSQPEMLALLQEKLAAPGAPRNVEPAEGDAGRTGLPAESCDLVLLANLWHELDDRSAVLEECSRVLRPGAPLAILDWRHDADRPPGPPLEHRVPMRHAIHVLEQAGWELHDYGEAGRYHYLLVATVADQSRQS